MGIFSAAVGLCSFAQSPATPIPTSINAKLVLDAAGPAQRKSLNAIYLIICPKVGAGSGFLLDTGTMVTNSHVVGTCTEQTLIGIGTANKQVKFSRVINDADRDLALLIPTEKLVGLPLHIQRNFTSAQRRLYCWVSRGDSGQR